MARCAVYFTVVNLKYEFVEIADIGKNPETCIVVLFL